MASAAHDFAHHVCRYESFAVRAHRFRGFVPPGAQSRFTFAACCIIVADIGEGMPAFCAVHVWLCVRCGGGTFKVEAEMMKGAVQNKFWFVRRKLRGNISVDHNAALVPG